MYPRAAPAQAGLGTSGSSSGNWVGGVSADAMPRDPTQVGRLQATRVPPLAGVPGAGELREARDPDALRLRGMLRPELGIGTRPAQAPR